MTGPPPPWYIAYRLRDQHHQRRLDAWYRRRREGEQLAHCRREARFGIFVRCWLPPIVATLLIVLLALVAQ